MEKAAGKEFKLEPGCELRLDKNQTLIVVLKSGLAEVFGSELAIGIKYEFTHGGAVFTWKGCTVDLFGQPDETYIFNVNEAMLMYLNCHAALETMRQDAEKDDKRGPILMVAGDYNAGKSTLCRLLVNYAVRVGRKPMYVNLDVGREHIGIPGTVGALLVEKPSNVLDGFYQESPIVFHFGHVDLNSNSYLYNLLVTELAKVCIDRLQTNKKVNKASGIVINTCGSIQGEGYKSLLQAAEAFEVDMILALDDRLYCKLVRDMPGFVKVLRLPNSGGVVVRSPAQRNKVIEESVREYFYGSRTPRVLRDQFYRLRTLPMYPHSLEVEWSEVQLYKFESINLPLSCMPAEMKIEKKPMKLARVTPGPSLLYHLFSVSFADSPKDDVVHTNVAGFVCVTDVDVERKTITILSPQPGPLPKCVLLLSDIQFVDMH